MTAKQARGLLLLFMESFGGARPGYCPQMPHIRQTHDIASGLRLVHFEPLDVFHDFAKADQQVDLRLSIGLTLQDLERSFDMHFALRYIFGFHLEAPFRLHAGTTFSHLTITESLKLARNLMGLV
jgi:hypothetical protein